MDRCLSEKISILLAGPFASGILATGPVHGAYFHHRAATDEILQRVRILQEICVSHNVPMQAAAIQFPLKHPAVASVVIGSASAQFMRENIKHLEFSIPTVFWDALKSAGIIPQKAPT
jgi:D-threo-aldose 1-dehydrogenase